MGELCIGGANLARGYVGQPGLTAERFVPDPEGGGGRLYRTGDLCRPQADGSLVFLGRSDQQVKLRGYRIEPGEIEAALRACPGVRDAAVVLRGEGEQRPLVGYAAGTAEEATLRRQLEARLPGYMVPSAIIVLDALPITPNGKTDRNALPDIEAGPRQALVAPRNAAEATLVAIWNTVLGREDTGVTDNFFELGGDSILSLRVVALAAGQGLRQVTPTALFTYPVLADLARHLTGTVAGLPASIVPLNRGGAPDSLFCIHPGYGLASEYRPVAQVLDKAVSVYGMESPLYSDPDWRAADMDALAAEYVPACARCSRRVHISCWAGRMAAWLRWRWPGAWKPKGNVWPSWGCSTSWLMCTTTVRRPNQAGSPRFWVGCGIRDSRTRRSGVARQGMPRWKPPCASADTRTS